MKDRLILVDPPRYIPEPWPWRPWPLPPLPCWPTPPVDGRPIIRPL